MPHVDGKLTYACAAAVQPQLQGDQLQLQRSSSYACCAPRVARPNTGAPGDMNLLMGAASSSALSVSLPDRRLLTSFHTSLDSSSADDSELNQSTAAAHAPKRGVMQRSVNVRRTLRRQRPNGIRTTHHAISA